MGNTQDIYKEGQSLKYGMYTDVKYVRTEIINGTEYAVLVDKKGAEKRVYLDLFEKHARVMATVPHERSVLLIQHVSSSALCPNCEHDKCKDYNGTIRCSYCGEIIKADC